MSLEGKADGSALDMCTGKIQWQVAQILTVLWVTAMKKLTA